jgi:hypothetical protein
MSEFMLPGIPGALQWTHAPVAWQINDGGGMTITAGPETDLFNDPAGNPPKDNVPSALFTPPDANFLLSAKVRVGFASAYDAGVLQVREAEHLWGKLCFEVSPQGQPMVVSVVTHGLSDDCNSVLITGDEVYLRVSHKGQAYAFHYSLDGRTWHFVRHFALSGQANQALRAGFASQAPTGRQCQATFSEITYRAGMLSDLRNGE